MNEPASGGTAEPEFIPDPEKEKQAKAVHFMISAIRLLGAIIAILGIVIVAGKLPPVPAPPGYVLIAIGMFQMWFLPIWIVRRYVKARVAEEELEQAAKQDSDS